jgi:TRAP-type C4-dicarboxylate transport system permease small subunit
MEESDGSGPITKRQRVLVGLGAVSLFGAMAADGVAVLGRHAGFALLGSIEIFQAMLVVALSCAILLASVMERHAAVDLLLGRVSAPARRHLTSIGKVSLAVTFGLLSLGSACVAYDLWGTHEMTEVLGVPLLPLRLVWVAASGLAALYFAGSFFRGLRP